MLLAHEIRGSKPRQPRTELPMKSGMRLAVATLPALCLLPSSFSQPTRRFPCTATRTLAPPSTWGRSPSTAPRSTRSRDCIKKGTMDLVTACAYWAEQNGTTPVTALSFTIVDNGDGKGQVLAAWHHDSPRPSMQQ